MSTMNILIVDDDPLIRRWLSMLLEQLDLEAFTVREAAGGEEALALCADGPVDLVFTDIKMPGISGLDLIGRLHERHPAIRTVVLSSYSDLKYVRTALQLGSLDYILKPEMTLEDLRGIMEKLRSAQKVGAPTISREEQAEFQYKNQLLHRLLAREMEVAELAGDLPLLAGGRLMISGLALDKCACETDRYLALKVILATLQSEQVEGEGFFTVGRSFVVVYRSTKSASEYQKKEHDRLIALWDRNLEQQLHMSIAYSMHGVCPEPGQLCQKVDELVKLLEMRAYYGRFVPADSISFVGQQLTAQLIGDLRKTVDLRNPEATAEKFRRFVGELHRRNTYPADIRALVMYGMTVLCIQARDEVPATTALYGKQMNRLQSAKREGDMLDAVEEFLHLFCESHPKKDLSKSIQQAVAYIDANYGSKLTLESVSAQVYLNRSYFSQLFRKQMGVGFSEYLEEVRLARAMELLGGTETAITDIADMVGFATQSYFARVFKQKTGMSPMRYRRCNRWEGGK